MKRFLLCSLLVINAVPAKAGISSTLMIGSLVLTALGEAYYHDEFRSVVDETWKQGAIWADDAVKRSALWLEKGKKKQEEAYALPKKEEIEQDTAEVLESNEELMATFKAQYSVGSKEVYNANKERLKKLETLLEECGKNDQAKCKEAQELEALIHKTHSEAIACASRFAGMVAQKEQKANGLKNELKSVTGEMVRGYEELKQIQQKEQEALDSKYDEKKKKIQECLEQPSSGCNQKVNEIQAAIDQLIQGAQAKITSEGLKLSAHNKRRQEIKSSLKNLEDKQSIEREFSGIFSKTAVKTGIEKKKSEVKEEKSDEQNQQPPLDNNESNKE